uniref:Calcyclin binding protein n=1 Tax=Oncorhynchus mykiss TaxID=8022 RepID=A0A8C7PIW7_ONCMY
KGEADPTSASKAYTVKKYILCYLHNIAPENVKVTLQRDRAMYLVLLVKYLDGKNHQMTINHFLYTIDVQNSSKKVKTDMVLVMCQKKTNRIGSKWLLLHSTKEKPEPISKDYENADPSDELMSMLKKMYSEGHNEMKHSINKAWSESQDKKSKRDGDMGNMDMF